MATAPPRNLHRHKVWGSFVMANGRQERGPPVNSAHTREAVDRRERVADKSVWMTTFEDYGVRPGSSDIAKNESYDVKEGCRKYKKKQDARGHPCY